LRALVIVHRSCQTKFVSYVKGFLELAVSDELATTPHFAGWKCVQLELRHDSKIISTSTESPVEIRVQLVGDCDDQARCCDELVAFYVAANGSGLVLRFRGSISDLLACPSTYVGKEADTASKCEARHTDIVDSAADYSNAMLLKLAVELAPSIAWPNIDTLLVGSDLDLVQLLQSNGNTALNTRGALKSSMTATLHGERTPGKACDEDGGRDLLGTYGLEYAVRVDCCLLCRPVRPGEGSVVARILE